MKPQGLVSKMNEVYGQRIETPGQLGEGPISTPNLVGRKFFPYSSKHGGSRKKLHRKRSSKTKKHLKKRKRRMKGGVSHGYHPSHQIEYLRGPKFGYAPLHVTNSCGVSSSSNMNASTQHVGLKGGSSRHYSTNVTDVKTNYLLRGTRPMTKRLTSGGGGRRKRQRRRSRRNHKGGRYQQYLSNVSYKHNLEMPKQFKTPITQSDIGMSTPPTKTVQVLSYDNYIH